MSNTRKVLVVHSPHSGRSALLKQAMASLKEHQTIEIVEHMPISELDGLSNQGSRWKEQGIDIVVAAGGDGLVGGVITHIAASRLPLGIIPLGTSNDVARSLGIPQALPAATAVIAQGQLVEVDIAMAQPSEQAPHSVSVIQGNPVQIKVGQQRHGYFAHALTIGLNVQFARLATNVATRKRYGSMTYPFAAFEVLRNHTALEMELRFTDLMAAPAAGTDPQTAPTFISEPPILRCRTLQTTVINAPIFGGAWQIAVPRATLYDGLLDIIVLEDIDLEGLNTVLTRFFNHTEQRMDAPATWHEQYPGLYPAELTGIPGIHHVQARGVTITTDIDPQDVTLDGEVRGQTPIHVRMADERLRVLVPR